MAKEKVHTLALELGADVVELAKLAEEKLPAEMLGGRGGLHLWIDRAGVPVLEEALQVPEFTPKTYYGRVVRDAPNPAFVYVHIQDIGKAVPTLIPRQFAGKLKGKRIRVEEIEDARGISYRWVRE